MKTIVSRYLAVVSLLLSLLLGLVPDSGAATCWLSIPTNNNDGSVIISAPWAVTGNYATNANPAYLSNNVTVGNPSIPAGSYLGWCVDLPDGINDRATLYGKVDFFSTCDPDLSARLEWEVSIGDVDTQYAPSVYVSPAVWQQVNYILNHKNNIFGSSRTRVGEFEPKTCV